MTESDGGISRREFLNRLALLGSLAACYPLVTLAQRRSEAESELPLTWLNQDPWKTLAEVQVHLFPASADTPGADDIQAIVYLHNTIENPRKSVVGKGAHGMQIKCDNQLSRCPCKGHSPEADAPTGRILPGSDSGHSGRN